MVTSGWVRAARSAFALVAVVLTVGVLAPSAGAGTYVRPDLWAHAEWPASTRCVSDFAWLDASRSSGATRVEIRVWHTSTGEAGCAPVRETSIDGQIAPSTFWIAPDSSKGRVVASGWVPCTGSGCRSRWVKVHVDAWFRHAPTSTTGPGGAIAWGTVTVNGCVVTRGWSNNSETNLVSGPLD